MYPTTDKVVAPPTEDRNNIWKIYNLTDKEQTTLNALKHKVVAVKRQVTTKVNRSTSDLDRFNSKIAVTFSEYERISYSTQDDKKITELTGDFHDLTNKELHIFLHEILLDKYDNQ